jgi:hypothetical protein
MAGDRIASSTEFFKQRFRDFMANDAPNASDLSLAIYNEARKIEVGGKSLNTQWAHERYPGVGMNVLTEAGDFPIADSSAAINPSLGLAHYAFAVDFSGHLEAQGSSKADGWAGAWAKKKSMDLRDKAQSLTARFCVGDGTANWGIVGAVNTTGDDYFTLASTSAMTIHAFHPGETVSFNPSTTGGTVRATAKITDVDYANERVYVDDLATGGSGTATAADYVQINGFYDAAAIPNGLQNIVAATGTIQGVNRATVGNFMYRATVQGTAGALGATDPDLLRDAVMDVAKSRSGKYSSKWCGNREMRRWCALATIGQVRFASPTALSLGTPGVTINDKDGAKSFIEDEYIRDGYLYAVTPSKFIVSYPAGMKGGYPVMNGNSAFWQATAASGAGYSDRKIMYWVVRTNMGCDDFRPQGLRSGILAPA